MKCRYCFRKFVSRKGKYEGNTNGKTGKIFCANHKCDSDFLCCQYLSVCSTEMEVVDMAVIDCFLFVYKCEACILYKKNEKLSQKSNKWIYVEIGNKWGDVSQNVQSTIRTNIQSSWGRGSIEKQKKVFGYTREERKKPSNSEYLNSIVAYVETKK